MRGREVERHTREAAEHRAELDRLAQQVSAAAAQLRHTELERDAARLAHDDVRAQFTVCQADRAARLEVIQQQGLRIAALQAEIDRLLRQAEREAAGQRAREAEHTARIQALQAEHAAHIQSLQAEHTAQVRTLELERDAARRAHDDVRAQFTVCQADRAARLEVIQQQGLQVSALHAEVDRWLKAAQALQAERDRLAGLQAATAAQLAELESRPVVRLLRRIGLIPPPGTGANRKTTP